MKILHTTDLHFNKKWFDWIEQQQSTFDLFCISGDFLEDSKDETLSEQIMWVTRWIEKFKKPLFVCSGNHDIEEFENEEWLNKIDTSNCYADNTFVTIDNVRFGSYPYIGGDGFFEYDDCDVLITHVPPAKTKTSTNKKGDDWGDMDLTRALTNKIIAPKIILCGHMHTPIKTVDIFKDTTIYNPGVKYNSDIPNYHVVEI